MLFAEQPCEGIQFIMSAFRVGFATPDAPAGRIQLERRPPRHTTDSTPRSTADVIDRTIGFSYGVQDCEAAVVALSLSTIESLLEFHSASTDGM